MKEHNHPQPVTLFFVDGYHGGTRGHMPVGAWRDILNVLRERPDWKLCLDIEAASWVRLKAEDPASFAELASLLASPREAARLEMVNGTFAQPFGWAVTGESNIRQFLRGRERIQESFPGVPVDTYATQEPCWASCLPQILLSLGYRAAVLKNPSTAWGGYSVGLDAETIRWVGPDGSAIPAVPRYACEELLDTWRTEAQEGSAAYAEKCARHGIAHPTGMCFQDLGWTAHPNVTGDHLRFVTWREYFDSVAAAPEGDWRFGIEDIRCTLPWGEKTIQQIARQVRSAEYRLLEAEKAAALAAVWAKALYPTDRLRDAWDKVLWAQHHDAWITATTRSGRDAWAWQVAAQTWDAEQTCNEIIEQAGNDLGAALTDAGRAARPLGSHSMRIGNTLGHARTDLVEIEVPTEAGTRSVQVRSGDGALLQSQFQVTRRSGDAAGSVGAGRLLFRAAVPAMGFVAYTAEMIAAEMAGADFPGATATPESDGSVVIDSDLYRIRVDASAGGVLSQLYAKQLGREFCGGGERRFNEYRGYFLKEGAWRSSVEQPAAVRIRESGPVRVTLEIAGAVSSVSFRTLLTVVQGQRRIDITTRFTYPEETWIGDPWDIAPAERQTERRRSHHDDRFKLLALFPVPFKETAIFKNAAFDVCLSRNTDTFFQRWDEIKHNIILDWVDVTDAAAEHGLAILSDHTTSYAHGPDHPLALVMGWGWEAGFWWGKCPLNGVQEVSYALVPHTGLWDKARLWEETARWHEPLRAFLQPVNGADIPSRSLLHIHSDGVQVTAMTAHGQDLLIRLFNAEGTAGPHIISFEFAPTTVEWVELDGRVRAQLQPLVRPDARHAVSISLPRFGLCTLRVRGALAE